MDESAILGKNCTYNSSNSTRFCLVQFSCYHAIFSQVALLSVIVDFDCVITYTYSGFSLKRKKVGAYAMVSVCLVLYSTAPNDRFFC